MSIFNAMNIFFNKIITILLIVSLNAFNYQLTEDWKFLKHDKFNNKPTYFGYSLAVHRSSLIVGAPRDYLPHDSIVRRGAVWKCDFKSNYNCQRLPFRLDGEANVRVGTSFDNKTDQWLGASLAANYDNIIAGSPFLKHRIKDGRNLDYEIPGGAMIGKFGTTSSIIDSIQLFSPSFFNWHSRNYNQEGYGEFGFQVALSQRPPRFLISSPGSFYFRGGLHSLPILDENYTDTRHPFTSPHYRWRDAGWLRYPSNYSSNEYDDWCYRGYTLAIGNFNHDDHQEIAISVPKLDNYRGAVEIINSALDEYSIRRINGSQIGEYFGASLCVVDLNGDGLDDLLVGAPMYSVKKDGHIIADAGRVDVFYQTADHGLVRKQSIEGTREGGRFGHALANLGDIDLDGFNDVAISMPFTNRSSSGMVYIYRGSKDGLIETPTQILENESIRGFGWSLQGQFDYDSNGYPDLAVGSIHSEKVAIILARPVLRLETTLRHSVPSMPLNCTLRSDDACIHYKCALDSFILKICMQLVDQNYKLSKRIDLIYHIRLDHGKNAASQRLAFRESYSSSKKQQFRLSNRVCDEYSLYIKEDVHDKLRPIKVDIEFSLAQKFAASVVPPILDPTSSKIQYNIPIQKDCGSDDVCVPNLRVSTSRWPNEYRVGLTPRIILNINVTNLGENAYDTQCFIQLPEAIEYVSANSSSMGNLYCTLMKQSDRIVVCQLGNPLMTQHSVAIQIQTAVSNYSAINMDPIVFHINVTSENQNITMLNTSIKVPVLSSPELVLVGVVKPDQISADSLEDRYTRYGATIKIPDRDINHTYTLYNKGPSDAKRIELVLMWPMLPAVGFYEQNSSVQVIGMPTILRVSNPKSKKDECFAHTTSFTELPRREVERKENRDFANRVRSSLTNNLLLQEPTVIDPFDEVSLPIFCHGPLCKTYICHIDTLHIGESVLIQLRAIVKHSQLLSGLERSKPFVIVSNASARILEIPLSSYTKKVYQHVDVQLKLATQIPGIVDHSSQSWILLIGISITAGVILLIILVGVLWCCGFFKRNRPKYTATNGNDDGSIDDQYHPAVVHRQPGRALLPIDSDELSSENNDENDMMIENPIDSLPIVIPQNSSRFIQQQNQQQQHQRNQLFY